MAKERNQGLRFVDLGLGQMLLALFRPASPWRLKGFRGRFVLLHEEDKTFVVSLPGGS